MAERYRPITQYDEKFENKEVEQSEENREDINMPKRSDKDLELLPQKERERLLESDLAYADPESYIRNKESERVDDALEGKFVGGNLLGSSVQPVVYDVADIMHYDEDGSMAATLGLPRGLRKNVNSLLKGISVIQIERDKGKNLGASLKIDEIKQGAINAERNLEADEIEEIQELESEIQSTLENIEEKEESVKENERIIGEYWLNQLEEDKQKGGGFFGSNSLQEVADSLGGSYMEIGAMATTWAAAMVATKAFAAAGTAAAGYTAATGGVGWMGPQALAGLAVTVAAFGVGVYSQIYSRSSESYAEMYGAYDTKIMEDVNHFKLMNDGREPTKEELAEIEKNAKGGVKDVYEQNMALMAGDAVEIGLAFIPWGKALSAVGMGGASAMLATRAGKFAIGAGGVGIGMAGEGIEEGYQHLIQSNYNDDEYGKEGFWRAVGNSIGTYGESIKGVGNHAISGILDYRVVGERSASSSFRAAANSGMALGGVMGGTHAALGQAKQRIHDRYNLAKHGEDAQLIADQFSPQAIDDRLLKEEQDITRFGWLFNKSKEGKGNFLNSAGIRKLASAYSNLKRINPELLEDVDEGAFFQTLNDAETYSDMLSDEKFSDLAEDDAQNAFIQLMRFSEASRDQRSKLVEAEMNLSSEIDAIPEASLAGFSDEQKEYARQAMVLKSKLGVVNSLLKGTQSVDWINKDQAQLNNVVNRKSKENFKKLKTELQTQYDEIIKESGLAKKDIKKLGKKNTGVQGAFQQAITHKNSAQLADSLSVDMLMSPNGKALANNPAVRDFANHMQEARKNTQNKEEDAKKEQTKITIPDGSNDLKSGEEAYKDGVRGKYREIDGKQYFVPDESENLTDEQVVAGETPGPQKIDNTEELEVKKTQEDAEIAAEKEVKKAAENIKEEEKETSSTPGAQLEIKFDNEGDPVGSPTTVPTVPTLEDVEETQEVVNEEANDGIDVTEETTPEDDNANGPIEIIISPGSVMPRLNVFQGGKSFMQFLLSKIEDIFIDESINVPIVLNRKLFEDLKATTEELASLSKKLVTDGVLNEKEERILKTLKDDEKWGGITSLLRLVPNKNASINFLVPNKGDDINLKISNFIKTLIQVVENDAQDKTSYASITNPIYTYNNTDQTFSVQSLFKGNSPIILGVSDGRSIMRGKNAVKALRGGSKGRLYAVVDGVTVKLNNRNLNAKEAGILYDLLTAKLYGDGGTILPDSGLTVSEYINMLVPTYSDAKVAQLGNPDHNLQIKNNVIIFGDPAKGQTLTRDNIEEQKDAFIQWAEENKKRRIHGRALGGNMFEQLKLTRREKIRFLGQTYTADSLYDEMLYAGENTEDHAISTDVEIINDSPITVKTVSVDTVIETTKKTPESTTISAPGGTDTNEIIVESDPKKDISDDIKDKPVPPKTGAGGVDLFMGIELEESISTERVNRKEAKAWLLKLLGPTIPIEFTPVFIRMANMDGFSYGRFHDAMITLSLKAPKGVEYHEGYHAIEELFLTDKEIQDLLKESKNNYPAPSQSALLKLEVKYPGISRNTAERIYFSEIRAEEYRMYETTGATAGVGTKALRWFKMLKGLITYVFTDKMTADLLFYRMSSGFYADKGPRPDKIALWKGDNKIEALDSELKNAIPQKNIENSARFLISQFIQQDPVIVKDDNGNDINIGGLGGYLNIKNVSDFSRLVQNSALVRSYIEGIKLAIANSDNLSAPNKATYLKNLDSVIDQLIDTTPAQKALLAKAQAEYESARMLVKNNPNNRFEDIKEGIAFLKEARRKFKLDELATQPVIVREIKKQLMALNIESKEEVDTRNKDVFAATKHTFESSNRDNSTTNTKVLLAFLNKYEKNEAGDTVVVRDPYTGLPQVVNYTDIWNPLEEELANIVPYSKRGEDGQIEYVFVEEQMLKKIKELSIKDPTFEQVLILFKDLNKNEQTQFLQAMSKGSNDFIQGQKRNTTKRNTYDGIVEEETTVNWVFFDPSKNKKKYRTLEKWVENLKDTVLYNPNTNEEVRIAKAKEVVNKWADLYFKVENTFKDTEEQEKKKTYLESRKYATEISTILKEIGIVANPDAILNLFNSENSLQENKNILKGLDILFRSENKPFSVLKISKGEGNSNFENENPINGEKNITLPLAKEASRFEKSYGQSSIMGATGSSYWDFGLNHYLKKKISQFKSNAGFYVDKLRASVFHSDSLLLEYLKTEEANIERRIFSGFKIQGAKKGHDYKDIDPAEERSLRLNLALNDIFIPMTPADKGTWNLISGFEAITMGDLREGFSYNSETETYIIPQKVKQIFSNYAITELKRMAQTRIALFGENPLPNEKLILDYHYTKLNKDGTPNRKTGNALKSQIFTSFNDKEVLKEMGVLLPDGTLVPTNTLAENVVFKKIIDTALNNLIKTEIKAAIEIETLTLDIGDSKFISPKNELDTATVTKLLADIPQKTPEGKDIPWKKRYDTAVRLLVAKYALSGTIANVETLKVFSGDPAFYKHMPDLTKRIPGIIAPGKDLILSSADEVFFRVAVFQDIKNTKGTALKEEYAKGLRDEGFTEEEIDNILAPYDDYSVTDAQGWITLDRWRFLNEKLGRFDSDSKEHVDAFNRLKDGIATKEDMKFMQAMPMKGMHFELRQEGNLQVPTYIKYSQAVLIPQFTKGRELNSLLEAMTEQKIDEVIDGIGVKVGALSPINIMGVTPGSILPAGEIKFNVMTLRNEYWKLQQDLTPHEEGSEALEGSQIKKNMLANIFQDAMYGNITGHELIRQMHSVDRQLSDLGKKELAEEFGLGVKNGNYVITDWKKIQKQLVKEFTTGSSKNKATKKLLASLELNSTTNPTGFAIPLDQNAFRNQINSAIGSFITKKTVKLRMPGGTYVQMSPYGAQRTARYSSLSEEQRNEIDKRINKDVLQPARKGKNKTNRVQILLPSWFQDLVPGNESMSAAEIGNYIKDNRLLNGIAYRIPNQGMSSIDAFEVVGFLPKSMADTVIAYDELTAKTGSDFDIDKMFIMLPAYGVSKKTGEPYYINPKNYLKEDGTFKEVDDNGNKISDYKKKQVLRNKKLELYASVIAHPKAFSQVITPLDSVTHKYNATKKRYLQAKSAIRLEKPSDFEKLENLLAKIDEKKSPENINKFISAAVEVLSSTKDLEFFSSNYQFEIKKTFLGGQLGVAQEARHLVDHSISQWTWDKRAPYRLSTYIGMGNFYSDTLGIRYSTLSGMTGEAGNLISTTLSGRLNAYVDIAKDPYIFYLNNNTITANTVALLDRLGVDPTWTDFFIAQPILESYVNEKRRYDSDSRPNLKNESGVILKPIEAAAYKLGFSKADVRRARKRIDIDTPIPLQELLDNLDSTKDKESETYKDSQLAILLKYEKLEKYASELNQAITASKDDTEGASGGIYDVVVSNALKAELGASELLYGFEDRFKATMLGKYHENSIKIMDSAFGDKFAVTSMAFRDAFRRIKEQTGLDVYKNADTLRKVTEHLYAIYMANEMGKTMNVKGNPLYDSTTVHRLFYGENSLAKRLKAYQKENSPIVNNSLIEYLTPQTGVEEKDADFIKATRTAEQDATDLNNLIDAWQELLIHPDVEVRAFAEDLSVYSFISTANTSTAFGFSELVPLDFENKLFNRVTDRIASVLPQETLSLAEYFSEQDIEIFVKNNMDFPKLVQEIHNDDVETTYRFRNVSRKIRGAAETIVRDIPKYGFYSTDPRLRIPDGSGNFKKYVKLKNSKGNNVLYKLVGVFEYEYQNRNGETRDAIAPVYAYMPKLGYRRGAHKLVEFKREHSAVPENLSYLTGSVRVDNNFSEKQVADFISKRIADYQSGLEKTHDLQEFKYHPTVDLSREWAEDLDRRLVYSKPGVNTMRTNARLKEHEHFGNPFSEVTLKGTLKVKSISAAVQMYKDWLLHNAITESDLVEGSVKDLDKYNAQREWILNEIKEGKLDGKKLLYAGKLAARGQGTHANALAEVVEEIMHGGMPAETKESITPAPTQQSGEVEIIFEPTVVASQGTKFNIGAYNQDAVNNLLREKKGETLTGDFVNKLFPKGLFHGSAVNDLTVNQIKTDPKDLTKTSNTEPALYLSPSWNSAESYSMTLYSPEYKQDNSVREKEVLNKVKENKEGNYFPTIYSVPKIKSDAKVFNSQENLAYISQEDYNEYKAKGYDLVISRTEAFGHVEVVVINKDVFEDFSKSEQQTRREIVVKDARIDSQRVRTDVAAPKRRIDGYTVLGEDTPILSDKEILDAINRDLKKEQPAQQSGEVKVPKEGAIEFNKLPSKSSTPTMTYAGIGSRATPQAELEAMTEAAKMLSEKGYTLRSGGAKGADTAFEKGTNKKEIFKVGNNPLTTELKIAEEIHPRWGALKSTYVKKLMARNTNQVFGKNLDAPVDFVLFYAEETDNPLRPKGGTGQAVEMARRKGIPTINMADTNWKNQLEKVLEGQSTKQSSKEINIYAGTGENSELSNFAERPFSYKGREYKNVEQAFQHQKLMTSAPNSGAANYLNDEVGQKILKAKTGAEAKKLGRQIKQLNTVAWDRISPSIMKDLIIASFEQNPEALQELLATGNATLTHKQDKSKWGKEFPRLLMEVREELGGQSTANPITAAITKAKLEEIKANKNFIKGRTKEGDFVDIGSGDEYETYYNTKTHKEYERTSNFIAVGKSITDIVKEKRKEGESVKDYNKRISKLKPTGINPKTKKPYTKEEWDKVIEQRTLVESSFVIGTKIDVFVRDFFDNTLQKDENGNIIYSAYDATGGDIAALRLFLSQLEQLKKRFEKTGETVEANDIILYDDELGIAGTVDLLTHDKNGVFRIYDLKTMRGNQLTAMYGNIAKYDSKKYGKSNREKHTDQLSVYRIMMNNTHGILSPSLEIVHMAIDYQAGDESSKKIDLLPENTILAVKNEVKGKIGGKEVIAKLKPGSQGTIVDSNTIFINRDEYNPKTEDEQDVNNADDLFGNFAQLEDTFMGQAERQSKLAEDAQNITGIHSGFTLSSQVETDLINNKGWSQEEVDEFNLYIAANRERFRNESIAFIAAVRLQEYLEQNAENIKEGEKMATKADKMLDRYLMNWLEEYDVTLNATSLQAIKERYGMDAIAITDVVNRVIAFSNDDLNAYTFPEEFSHMLIELLGSNNEIVKPLLDNIEGWGKYNSIFNLYRKQKAYQNPDGSPNVSKIKNEAAGKILSEAIVMQNTNRSKPKGKFLKLAYELLEKIKEFFGSGESRSVNGIANKIARQVLFENKEWANKYIERKEKRVFNKEKNIESQESEETLRVIRNVVTRLGGKLTNQFKVGANGSMFKSGTTSASNLDFTVPQLFKKPNLWTEKSAELVKTFIEDKNTVRLTLDEAINSIDSQSKGDKILIEILKPYLKGKSIYYQDGWHFKLDHPTLKGRKYGATVSSNGDILIFNKGNFDLHTIIHEALHTLVHTKINRTSRFEFDEEFAEEIQRLYDLVKQDSSLVERYSYAFTNLDEFVSEAFGNGSFRQELAYIEDTLSPYSSNIFKSFLDAIRNFLKSKYDFEISNSALESIFNAVDHSIQKAGAIEKAEIEIRTLEWVNKDLKAALPNFTLSQIVEIDNNSYRVDGVISDINSVKESFLEKKGTNAERMNKLSKFEKDNAVAVSFNFKPDNEVANLSYGTWDKAFDSQIYKGTSELNRFAGIPIESGLETTSVEAFYASLDLSRVKVKAESIIRKYGTGTGNPIRSYKEKFYIKKDTGTMAVNENNAIKFVKGVNDKYFNGDKVVKIITDNSFKRRVIVVPGAFNGGQIDLFDSDNSTNPQRTCR